jgi:two-component system, OmpR family, sensor histidine kinase BaeS
VIRAGQGIGARIAVAALIVAGVALAVLALGVIVIGADRFSRMMAEHGTTPEASALMFREAVVTVVAVAIVAAILVALLLAAVVGARLARPLQSIEAGARRIALGDYAARIPTSGPAEIAMLAESFNQMAMELEDQERMRREFIANAAHELRTPLTNLKGYLEALRDGVIEPDRATLDSLWEEAERLVRLSNSLDTLATGDAGPMAEPIDLDAARAVRAAVDLAMPAINAAGLSIRAEVPDSLSAHADPDGLAQVLGNLLQNAIRYTPRGGEVAVEARQLPRGLEVSVSNTGPGIPREDLAHVFERFYRVDKSRAAAHGGAGIGLAIVRQIVEASGGDVGAESKPGLTRFWFRLPAGRLAD